jgi:hypothetical protein
MDKFYIGAYDNNSGLQKNIKPFLLPDNAFATLDNAYVFRGRVRKRFGSKWVNNSQLQTRLRVYLGNTDNHGILNGAVPNASGLPGQQFSIGNYIYTVVLTGNNPMLDSGSGATTHTFNTANGQYSFVGAPATTAVYWYPCLPVMGIASYEALTTPGPQTIFFDTQFAYQFDPVSGGINRLAGGASTWTGNDSQFFWSSTYLGLNAYQQYLFVTNFNQLEPMRYWDGIALTWTNFTPLYTNVGGAYTVQSARIIVKYANRLIFLNTWENTPNGLVNYPGRARWSWTGSPIDVNAFNVDMHQANFVDAPTTEAIITAQFIKNNLIVFFERSTWQLSYQGNNIYPFIWQQINTELGAESTFSIVPFDKIAIGIGNVGIHACNGQNVERIDDKVPDEVFQIHNPASGVNRISGIRDYKTEMVYWTFPATDASSDFPYPNRIFVYNYKTLAWAFNDDSFTAFGYFIQPPQSVSAINWDSTIVTWDDNVSWDGNVQIGFRNVIAGNQQGWIEIIDADVTKNAPALSITNMVNNNGTITITSYNHNLRMDDYIYIENIAGDANYILLNQNIYQVSSIIDKNNFTIQTNISFIGTYLGAGTIARISVIDIVTKEYNFYADKGRNAAINRIDFMVDNNTVITNDNNGNIDGFLGPSFQINFFSSSSLVNLYNDSVDTNTILGTATLDTFAYPYVWPDQFPSNTEIPLEVQATRLWRPVYFSFVGEVLQFEITMNNEQITTLYVDPTSGATTGPAFMDFQLNAMVIYSMPADYNLQ